MANFYNDNDNFIVSGTSDNDSIQNGGYWYLNTHKGGNNVTISAGNGDDTVNNDGRYSGGDSVKIYTGDGNDYVSNVNGNSVTIDTGAGDDTIYNYYSDKVSINTGAGNDFVYNQQRSLSVTIITGIGNDTVENNASNVTINPGAGNDLISLSANADNNVIIYNNGDGNDTIYGFNDNDTLSIASGTYSTKKSGEDIIVTVGEGKITLVGASSNYILNINGTKSETAFKKVTNSDKATVIADSEIVTIDAWQCGQ